MFMVRYEYLQVPYGTHLKFYFFFIVNPSGQKTSHKTKRHIQPSDGPLSFMSSSISKDIKKKKHILQNMGPLKPITIPTTLTSNHLKSVSDKQRDCHSDYFFFFFFSFLILFL